MKNQCYKEAKECITYTKDHLIPSKDWPRQIGVEAIAKTLLYCYKSDHTEERFFPNTAYHFSRKTLRKYMRDPFTYDFKSSTKEFF